MKGLGLLEGIHEEVDQYGHGGSGGKGYQPGQEDVRRHLEVESFAGVFPDGGPCDGRAEDVGGRDGCADAATDEDDQGSRELGREALDGSYPYLAELLADGSEDTLVVPGPMAAAAVTTTQKGTPPDSEWPNSAMRTSVITPIVFCPSLEPCGRRRPPPRRLSSISGAWDGRPVSCRQPSGRRAAASRG